MAFRPHGALKIRIELCHFMIGTDLLPSAVGKSFSTIAVNRRSAAVNTLE
jgi:hypothetical protein